MRAFFLGVIAALVIAAGAAFVLNDWVQQSSSLAFSTSGVRI